jgi:ketosteroid isomerase-like protein
MHSATETAAIQAVLDAQAVAWSQGDLDAFMQYYWNDPALYYASSGTLVRGWQPLLDSYRARYGEGAALGSAAFSDVQIDLLGAEAAKAHGRFEVTVAGKRAAAGSYTLVLRRFAGEGWKIVADQVSPEVTA